MLSAAYQMSSQMDRRCFDKDSDNRLIWRMEPRRLDVEAWRDGLLAVTGGLDRTLRGPATSSLLNSPRRTLYSIVSRSGDKFESDDFLRLFDFPSARATSASRSTSIVPQQYLFMMNSSFMAARAGALAARLQEEAPDDSARVARAYRLLFGRAPSGDEARAASASSRPGPTAASRHGSSTRRCCSVPTSFFSSADPHASAQYIPYHPEAPISRRHMLQRLGAGVGSLGLAGVLAQSGALAPPCPRLYRARR